MISLMPPKEYLWNMTPWEDHNNTTNMTDFNETLSPLDNDTQMTVNDGQDYTQFLITLVSVTMILSLVILATIVGNVFVIAAIVLEKNLQTVGNYLVMSLAVADLMVACLVMPIGAVYEVRGEWILGPELCEFWTSADVLCCTASILHLLAIALDRYWAVTNVDYIRQRSHRRIGTMIVLVWAVGFLVSFLPILGWKDEDFLHRTENEKRCLVSQDTGYQVFATCSTFYVPLVMILILYWRIFQVARKRIRHKPGSKSSAVQPKKQQVAVIMHKDTSFTNEDTDYGNAVASCATNTTAVNGSTTTGAQSNENTANRHATAKKKKPSRESVEAKRERKAAKTLAIITGVFVICWLPFFVTAFLMAVCGGDCDPGPYLFSFFLWLGYANSMLNPIIYTIFSPDFRLAFKKRILCGRKNRQTYR